MRTYNDKLIKRVVGAQLRQQIGGSRQIGTVLTVNEESFTPSHKYCT